jgi:hypothetical protein
MRYRLATAVSIFAMLAGFSISARAQEKGSQSPQTPPAPQAAPAAPPAAQARDVDPLQHIMAAVYDVISGPAGPRDWNRFRSLFAPGARLIPTWRDDKGNIKTREMSSDDYVTRGTAYFEKQGFFENALANRTESWDQMAHVWSTYESRHAKGEKPFARGINSFQFYFDGTRWWVLTICWEEEDASHTLPEKYLTDAE